MMRPRLSRTPFVCPICGEKLLSDAKSCPGCGACERSGWSGDAIYDGVDFSEDNFNEPYLLGPGAGRSPSSGGLSLWSRVIAVIILLALLALFLGRANW